MINDLSNDYQAIFEKIISDDQYKQNLDWGKPRRGHPEGTVRAHIAELEQNLESLRWRLSNGDYWKLKILIHTHDTFKSQAAQGARITDPQSHASLARQFLAKYCNDPDLLDIVQYHDEPYALWNQYKARNELNQHRMDALLATIRDWNLFSAFLIIDGCTIGKARDSLRWFFQTLDGKVASCFTEADILD